MTPVYTNRITWHNNNEPALNEENLNKLSTALGALDDRVVMLAGDIYETIPELQEALADAEELEEKLEVATTHPPYIGANGNWWTWDTSTEQFVDSGIDASITVTIADVTMLPAGSTPYVTNTGTNTDPIFHLFIPAQSVDPSAYVPSTRKVNGHALSSDVTVTKSDVGLENVPNVTTDNQTPTVTEASTRANLATGDTLKTIIGKIKKYFTDLKTVAFTGLYDDLANLPTLGSAASKNTLDASSASPLMTREELVTERHVYYGTPKINNSKSYSSNTAIYAPTGGGTSGQYLKAEGSTSTPTWQSADTTPTASSSNLITSGGVYTALTDGSVTKIAEGTVIASQSDLDNLVKDVMLDHKTRFFRVTNSTIGTMFSYGGQNYKYGFGQLSTSYVASTSNNIIMLHFVGFAGSYATRTFMYACSHDGTTASYTRKGISADVTDKDILTGTPTNINSNLTLDGSNSRIQKSGNVVCFKLQFNIATTYTPSSVLDSVCTLPFKPVGWENVSRLIATASHGNAVMGAGFLSSSGMLCIGTSPYTGLTAGNEMVFTGTYMTND